MTFLYNCQTVVSLFCWYTIFCDHLRPLVVTMGFSWRKTTFYIIAPKLATREGWLFTSVSVKHKRFKLSSVYVMLMMIKWYNPVVSNLPPSCILKCGPHFNPNNCFLFNVYIAHVSIRIWSLLPVWNASKMCYKTTFHPYDNGYHQVCVSSQRFLITEHGYINIYIAD